jgi:hypothetical protein
MPLIHLAGEMAVWSEENWAAFEGGLQRQLRAERRRRAGSTSQETAAWGVFALAILLVLL